MFPGDVAIGRTADINEKTTACLLISEEDVRMIRADVL